jgi:hypothetical protein
MSINATELRVHGVSGIGADAMLDRPLVFAVAGDRGAGFYRPSPVYGDTTGPGGAKLEAYRWSNLTAGTATRTLSLVLLLPFMLSNLAFWMRPPTQGPGHAAKALCRLLAATITVTYVLSIIGIALDLVAWQCMPYPRCVANRRYLSWLVGLPPGPRLAILALVPIAAISIVWWLGSRVWRAYEAFRYRAVAPSGDRLDAVGRWDGMPLVGRLRSIHVAVAFATVDASLLTVIVPRDGSIPGFALLAATVALLTACLGLLCVRDLPEQDARGARVEWASRAVRVTACGITALTLVYASTQGADWPEAGALPGYGYTVTLLFVAQTALLVVLGTVAWQRRNRDENPAILRGLAPPVLASVAIGLAVAFSAGLVYRVADFLDRDAVPNPIRPVPVGTPPLLPPIAYRWAVVGFLVAVLSAALVAAYWTVATRHRRRRAAAEVTARDFPDAPATAASRIRQVRDAVAKAQITERMAPLLVAYSALAVFALASAGFALAGIAPAELARRMAGESAMRFVSFIADVGTYFIGLLVLGLVVVGLLAYQVTGIQRYVGVLWDLGTFWPRVAHPFAPPCYAERAVPELGKRIQFLAEQGNVVLSGHSHGAVLLASAVLQLPPESCRRVALLTYASPLHRVYRRLFPAYVGDQVLRDVGDRLGWRWLNLWRDTDPIGGWTFSPHRLDDPPTVDGPAGKVDWRLRDPRGVTVPPSDTVPPPVEGHWPFHTDERFATAVHELMTRLEAPPAK